MGNLVSECCGSNEWFSLGEVHVIYQLSDKYLGVCSECKENAIFHDITEKEWTNDNM